MLRLFCNDVLAFLRQAKPAKVIIADPPDNIGLDYANYSDKLPTDEYYYFLELLILESLRLCETMWLSYYWKHDLRIKSIVERVLRTRHPAFFARTFIWRFGFGQHCETDCGSGYRPILRISRGDSWVCDRVESERQRIGDSRANPLGRVPDDVWDFPRVTHGHPERRTWHPTQHPAGLIARMVRMAGGGPVLDLFSGSGTCLRVCKEMNVPCIGVEFDPTYCQRVADDLGIKFETL